MSIRCVFTLNNKNTSILACAGFGNVEAFSGQMQGRDNPREIATPKIGPIPPGIYYIVDRQSGGHLGWIYDEVARTGIISTDHSKWFALLNPRTGDATIINGVRRGEFRLHPSGPQNRSEGCITVVHPAEFEALQKYIRRNPPQTLIPGNSLKAYGTMEVR
jgi:hypothetical protein